MFRFSYSLISKKKKSSTRPIIDELWSCFLEARRNKTQNEIGLEYLRKAEYSANNFNQQNVVITNNNNRDLFEESFLQDQCDDLILDDKKKDKKAVKNNKNNR